MSNTEAAAVSEPSASRGFRRAVKAWLVTVLLCGVFSFFKGCGAGPHIGISEDYTWEGALFGMFVASWTLALFTALIAFLSGSLNKLKAAIAVLAVVALTIGWFFWILEPYAAAGTAEGTVVGQRLGEHGAFHCVVEPPSGARIDVLCEEFGNPLGVPDTGDRIRFTVLKAAVTGRLKYSFAEYIEKHGAQQGVPADRSRPAGEPGG